MRFSIRIQTIWTDLLLVYRQIVSHMGDITSRPTANLPTAIYSSRPTHSGPPRMYSMYHFPSYPITQPKPKTALYASSCGSCSNFRQNGEEEEKKAKIAPTWLIAPERSPLVSGNRRLGQMTSAPCTATPRWRRARVTHALSNWCRWLKLRLQLLAQLQRFAFIVIVLVCRTCFGTLSFIAIGQQQRQQRCRVIAGTCQPPAPSTLPKKSAHLVIRIFVIAQMVMIPNGRWVFQH